MITDIKDIIAKQLQLAAKAVENTIALLDEGCTIPFISRYRKEKTGGLDEVQIGSISQLYEKMKELIKRKETIIKTINELGKMTKELQKNLMWALIVGIISGLEAGVYAALPLESPLIWAAFIPIPVVFLGKAFLWEGAAGILGIVFVKPLSLTVVGRERALFASI